MVTIAILILIVAKALPGLNTRISSIFIFISLFLLFSLWDKLMGVPSFGTLFGFRPMCFFF